MTSIPESLESIQDAAWISFAHTFEAIFSLQWLGDETSVWAAIAVLFYVVLFL